MGARPRQEERLRKRSWRAETARAKAATAVARRRETGSACPTPASSSSAALLAGRMLVEWDRSVARLVRASRASLRRQLSARVRDRAVSAGKAVG